MLTEIGKYLRKLRIDHDETLVIMARKLGVTASLLSYVETGKRTIPDSWFNEIPRLYRFTPAEAEHFRKLGIENINCVRTNVEGQSEDDKVLALAFARRLSELTEEEKDEIRQILQEKEDI